MKTFLNVEQLEDRSVPSTNSVLLDNGILTIKVDQGQAHTAVISNPTVDTVQVKLDGKTFTFTDPVTTVNYTGGRRADNVTNLTTIAGTIDLGGGKNILLTNAAGGKILGGNGSNVVQAQAGGSTIQVGNGDNNIYGGPGDTITAGKGENVIYDILGASTITIAPDGDDQDYIFAKDGATVNGIQANDRVAFFFAANRQPGSGTLVLEKGVLYFTGNGNGNQFILNRVGNKIVATYNLNDGTGFKSQVFNRADVKLLANFGGAGNDTFINNTDIPDVQYGAGGSNLLIGGFGPLNLEKAGGAAGTSVAIGRSPRYNDLNGSGNANIQTTMILNPCAQTNIVRTNNPADLIFGFDDRTDVFVSPFRLTRGKR